MMNNDNIENLLENNNQPRDIKIPIKAIIELNIKKHKNTYADEFVLLMRRYFIACLNLGYLRPNDLDNSVAKFCEQISVVYYAPANSEDTKYCEIAKDILFINEPCSDERRMLFEINCFKTIFEVIANTKKYKKHPALKKAIASMVGEKIWVMDTAASRIVMPSTENIQIGNKTFQLRAGYSTNNLLITLLKQLFISQGINENRIIQESHFIDFAAVVKNRICINEKLDVLLNTLDVIPVVHKKELISEELELLKKYQDMVNEEFTTCDQNYFAFLALVLDDKLRQTFMAKNDE